MCDLSFEDPIFTLKYRSKFDPGRDQTYVFVGGVEESLQEILQRLGNRSKIHGPEVTLLKKIFGTTVFQGWVSFLQTGKKNKIHFVNSRIMMDDSLNEIKRKIFVYCSRPDDNMYIHPSNMSIWMMRGNSGESESKEKATILGYKYKGLKPHLYEEMRLETEFDYALYEQSENMNIVSSSSSTKKKSLLSSDNYTLLYDLLKKNEIANHTIYFCNAYDEYNILLATKKYKATDLQKRYFRNYFPVCTFEMDRAKMNSIYLLAKDDSIYTDFITQCLFQLKFDKNRFQSCYFNNIHMQINQSTEEKKRGLFEGGAKERGKSRTTLLRNSSSSSSSSLRSKNMNILSSSSPSSSSSMSYQKNVINGPVSHQFVDLYQIFEYIRSKKMGKKTPFLRYNDYNFNNPFTLISKNSVDENLITKELVRQWLYSDLDKQKRVMGLQVKRYIKDIQGSPHYSTIKMSSDGRVQLDVAFTYDQRASFRELLDTIGNCKQFIEDLNQNIIDYRMSRSIPIDQKIRPPSATIDPREGILLSSNTKISFINYFIEYTSNETFKLQELFQFCKLFPRFLTLQADAVSVNSIKARYNRVSGFVDLDEIMSRISTLKENQVKDGLIIKIIEKEFGKTTDECKRYFNEYKRKYSIIQSSSSDSEKRDGFLITITKTHMKIDGIRNTRQMYDTYRFLCMFMHIFLHRAELRKNESFRRNLFTMEVKEKSKEANAGDLLSGLFQAEEKFALPTLDLNVESANDYVEDEAMTTRSEIEEGEGRRENKIDEKSILRLVYGTRRLAGDNEIGTDVQLTCEDAIPEIDTCQDFCNDAKYFLRRLQRYDNRLFYDKRERIKGKVKYSKYKKYSKSCQKFRQPVVIGFDPNQGYDPISMKEVKRESYSYAIKYGSNMEEPNWYICPRVWCPKCQIPIPYDDIDPATIRKRKTEGSGGTCITGICPFGDHQVFIRDGDNPYPGFQKGTTDQGYCIPCCFNNPQTDPKYGKFSHFKKCLGEDVQNNNDNENIIYVLGKSVPLDKNRYGIMIPSMEVFLNSHIETGYLAHQKGYLRRGIHHENNNSFLSAIANIFSCDTKNVRSVEFMKQWLVDKLDKSKKLFISLYGGNLLQTFHDPHKDVTPIQNFKNYILSRNIEIPHTYLWDFIQRPGVISENGVNLFIFEDGLLCPMGENIKDFYHPSRKTIILYKHNQYYEPIYYLEGNGKQANYRCIFDNQRPELMKLFEVAHDGCKSVHKIDWSMVLRNHQLNMQSEKGVGVGAGAGTGAGAGAGNVDAGTKADFGLSLMDTLQELSKGIESGALPRSLLPIQLQYVDTMNKVFGILLGNKTFLPVAPSKIMDMPLPYRTIDDYDELSNISYKKTLELFKEISSKTAIPCRIVGSILDLKGEKIVAVLTEKLRIVPVQPTLKRELVGKIVPMKYYSDVDMYLKSGLQMVDKRIIYMNKKKYEDETYIRIRFELARFFQENRRERDLVFSIIQSEERDIRLRRERLERVLVTIFDRLLSTQSNHIDYNFYKRPNHRIPCGSRQVVKNSSRSKSGSSKSKSNSMVIFSCEDDPHCVAVNKSCKLHVNEQNLMDEKKKNMNLYLPMILEELLRFRVKQREIMEDLVPNIIDKEDIMQNPTKYYMIHSSNPETIYQNIEMIFLDKEGLYIDQRPTFDMSHTQDYALPPEKYTLSNVKGLYLNSEEIPPYWSKYFNDRFILVKESRDHKSLFSIVEKILAEMMTRNNTRNEANKAVRYSVRGMKNMMISFMEDEENRPFFERILLQLRSYQGQGTGAEARVGARESSLSSSSSNNRNALHHVIDLYKACDPGLYRNVHDMISLKNKIFQDDYEGCDADIAVLGAILHFNILVLNKKLRKTLPNATLYRQADTADYLLLLRNNNIHESKYQAFQIKGRGYLHKEKDYSEKFMRSVVERLYASS